MTVRPSAVKNFSRRVCFFSPVAIKVISIRLGTMLTSVELYLFAPFMTQHNQGQVDITRVKLNAIFSARFDQSRFCVDNCLYVYKVMDLSLIHI